MDRYVAASMLPTPSMFVWRFGVWTALMVVSVMTLILSKRYFWLFAYVPVFVYLVTLLLASGWTDFRYGLPVMFVGMFLPVALFMGEGRGEKMVGRRE